MAGSDGSVLKHLSRLRLVSVVVLDNAALADGLVSALVAGGDERLLEERDGILAGQRHASLSLDPPFGILGRVDRVVVRWFWSRA